MRRLLAKVWFSLWDGMWFLPATIVVGCIVLAYLALALDVRYDAYISYAHPRIFGVSASGAYTIFSSIATSIVTVAGVSFSITVVALSLAANQYSPRTLRNYMNDRGNQVVLGFFLGTFAYPIVMLRTIESGAAPFVPSIAVLVAIGLALASLAMFIYFLQHVSISLGAFHIIGKIAMDTGRSLERLFRESGNGGRSGEDPPGPWREVPALQTGYLQSLDLESLTRFGAARCAVIRMSREVGAFLVKSECLLAISSSGPLSERELRKLNAAATVKRFRTIDQDPGFGIRQIVDIALKALSPGVNDTTTALTCIDYLGAVLLPVAGLRDPSCRHLREGTLRLITREETFAGLLEQAFVPIIPWAAGNAEVVESILRTVDRLSQRVEDPRRLDLLRRLVERCSAAAGAIVLEEDRKRVLERAAANLRRWAGE